MFLTIFSNEINYVLTEIERNIVMLFNCNPLKEINVPVLKPGSVIFMAKSILYTNIIKIYSYNAKNVLKANTARNQ